MCGQGPLLGLVFVLGSIVAVGTLGFSSVKFICSISQIFSPFCFFSYPKFLFLDFEAYKLTSWF